MTGSILRHVQNTLIIMSVLLVVLAFQRLESFEDAQRPAPPSSLWPHPPMDEWEDDASPAIRIGQHHELVFGHELRIGLFRFVLPKLVRTESQDLAKSSSSLRRPSDSDSRKRVKQGRTKSPKTVFVVSIDSCMSADTLEAAAVLANSLLPTKSLYAFLMGNSTQECSDALQGYQIVTAKKMYPSFDVSACVSRDNLELLLAHGLDADTVVSIPLPSLAVPAKTTSESATKIRSKSSVHKHQHGALPVLAANSTIFVRTVQPVGRKKVKRVLDSIAKKCSTDQNTTSLLPQWELCLECRVSETLVIHTFAGCPMPWRRSRNESKILAECIALGRQWLEERDSLRVQIKHGNVTHSTTRSG